MRAWNGGGAARRARRRQRVVSAEQLVSARDRFGIDILGPVSADTSWQTKDVDAFQTTDFQVDWDDGKVICPQGNASLSMVAQCTRTGHPVIKVNFSHAPIRSAPVSKARSRKRSAVTVSADPATLAWPKPICRAC